MRGSHYIGYQWDAKDASMTFYPYAIHYLFPNMFDLCPFVEKNMAPRRSHMINLTEHFV